jgi:hypothetical protein
MNKLYTYLYIIYFLNNVQYIDYQQVIIQLVQIIKNIR